MRLRFGGSFKEMVLTISTRFRGARAFRAPAGARWSAVGYQKHFSMLLHGLAAAPAHGLFDEMCKKYNRMILEYDSRKEYMETVRFFLRVRRSGFFFDGQGISCVLKACNALLLAGTGLQIHNLCVKHDLLGESRVFAALMEMYFKVGGGKEVSKVFDQIKEKDDAMWNFLITGYANNGSYHDAFMSFSKMRREGVNPNCFSIAAIVKSIIAESEIAEIGMQIHAIAVKLCFDAFTFVCNSLVNFYFKCGEVTNARSMFHAMMNKDTVTWNTMISGFVTNQHYFDALQIFNQMRRIGIALSDVSFPPMAYISSHYKDLDMAKQLHCQSLRYGFADYRNVMMPIMTAYSKCNEMDGAIKLFTTVQEEQNVISWTAMISGLLQNNMDEKAAILFREMIRNRVQPNDFTLSAILSSGEGFSPSAIHAITIKKEYEKFPSVGTALLDAYVKQGRLPEASIVFKSIDEKDVVAWSAIISAYAKAEDVELAANAFRLMLRNGVTPNEYTLSSVINACASSSTAAMKEGKQLHLFSIKSNLHSAVCVSSALVTMYSKLGDIKSAGQVFDRQSVRDLISWNSMICGYAQHGEGRKALDIFHAMEEAAVGFDEITFVGVISACAHAGLINEGRRYFNEMTEKHQIEATAEHFSCMVDLYSRAGMLKEALGTIRSMTKPASLSAWRSLLSAAYVHHDVEVGEEAAREVIALQPEDSSGYVLLSNIQARAGNWKARAKIRKAMDGRKVRKEAGCSWIEVKNRVHYFVAGDESHAMSEKLYGKLEEMARKIRDMGYRANTSCVLQDIDEEQKEAILWRHSERLAVALGVMETPAGWPIYVAKNLRVCEDCHEVMKLVSRVEKREIVVRDCNRFHRFHVGLCSCGDFW